MKTYTPGELKQILADHKKRIDGEPGGVRADLRSANLRSANLYGADLCGKGQPVQMSAASHGCPAAVFRDIRVDSVA